MNAARAASARHRRPRTASRRYPSQAAGWRSRVGAIEFDFGEYEIVRNEIASHVNEILERGESAIAGRIGGRYSYRVPAIPEQFGAAPVECGRSRRIAMDPAC